MTISLKTEDRVEPLAGLLVELEGRGECAKFNS